MRKLDGAIIDLRLLMIVVIFYKLEYLVRMGGEGEDEGADEADDILFTLFEQ